MTGVGLGRAGLAAEEARVWADREPTQRLPGPDSRLGNVGEGLVDGGRGKGEQPAGLLAAGDGGAGGVVALQGRSRAAGSSSCGDCGRGNWGVGRGTVAIKVD